VLANLSLFTELIHSAAPHLSLLIPGRRLLRPDLISAEIQWDENRSWGELYELISQALADFCNTVGIEFIKFATRSELSIVSQEEIRWENLVRLFDYAAMVLR